MRKTSQDGGDSTSITSGFENELRKPGIIKTTRNSLKRRVQNFSHESDDAVIEPLLQKDKVDIVNQSAKYLMSKSKTEQATVKGKDKEQFKQVEENMISQSFTILNGKSEGKSVTANGVKGSLQTSMTSTKSDTIRNHMNNNIFVSVSEGSKETTPQTQILVEIDGQKPIGHSSSPLIFTTAKIHIDNKTKNMEPVHVTSVPILSTIECNNIKSQKTTSNDKFIEVLNENPTDDFQKKMPTNTVAMRNEMKVLNQTNISIHKSFDQKPLICKDTSLSETNNKSNFAANASFNLNTKLALTDVDVSKQITKENKLEDFNLKNKNSGKGFFAKDLRDSQSEMTKVEYNSNHTSVVKNDNIKGKNVEETEKANASSTLSKSIIDKKENYHSDNVVSESKNAENLSIELASSDEKISPVKSLPTSSCKYLPHQTSSVAEKIENSFSKISEETITESMNRHSNKQSKTSADHDVTESFGAHKNTKSMVKSNMTDREVSDNDRAKPKGSVISSTRSSTKTMHVTNTAKSSSSVKSSQHKIKSTPSSVGPVFELAVRSAGKSTPNSTISSSKANTATTANVTHSTAQSKNETNKKNIKDIKVTKA